MFIQRIALIDYPEKLSFFASILTFSSTGFCYAVRKNKRPFGKNCMHIFEQRI